MYYLNNSVIIKHSLLYWQKLMLHNILLKVPNVKENRQIDSIEYI